MLKKFLNDRGGNFAMMFSFIAVPIMLGIGLVVDYTNLLRVQQELQIAVDSAALAIAQKGDTISNAQADELGDQFLDENFDESFTKLLVQRGNDRVSVSAETKVMLAFGGLIGVRMVDVSASASADIANASYEISLALDTTGSMEGGKLQSMKDAVKVMVDNLAEQNPRTGSLKFSVVPFSSMVNVGPQFGPSYFGNVVTRQAVAWIDDLADSPVVQNDLDPGISRFAMFKHLNSPWQGCVETRPTVGGVDYGTNDDVPNRSKPETLFVPAFAGDDNDNEIGANNYLNDNGTPIATGTPVDRMARYGANYPATMKNDSFAQQIARTSFWANRNPNFGQQSYYSNYPVNMGPDFGCDMQPIMPLTTNFNSVKNKVDSLVARGSTNIVEGAMWGWRTLSSRLPFAEGASESRIGVKKIMVLLTDGTNSMGLIPNTVGSSYSSFGYLADGRLGLTSGTAVQVTDAMNAKTLAACTNAKADGIEIYTVRLEEPNVTTGNMLLECASSPDQYLDVPNRLLLDEAFAKIAQKIASIRLSS